MQLIGAIIGIVAAIFGVVGWVLRLRRPDPAEEAAARVRRTEQKQKVVSTLGAVLIEAAEGTFTYDKKAPEWRSRVWPYRDRLAAAIKTAEQSLPPGDARDLSQVVLLAQALEGGWMACVQGGDKVNPDVAYHVGVARKVLEPCQSAMLTLGTRMLSWDGVGEMPTVTAPSDLPPGGVDSTFVTALRARYLDRFDSHGELRPTPGKLVLTKHSGVRFLQRDAGGDETQARE
ncbi:hypothetical protein H7J86_00600 [Mycobacterium hackensackense]|uniref:hypothetical protein n=1 Tax=Mycobacterium hackensackense TaxID=228909 RepID=UPI0022657F5D|nr:hypothetical protein [Mycobacterium hackensackense]MCV7250659.1 hypothetical protein [Mycobacterium hackensackense]